MLGPVALFQADAVEQARAGRCDEDAGQLAAAGVLRQVDPHPPAAVAAGQGGFADGDAGLQQARCCAGRGGRRCVATAGQGGEGEKEQQIPAGPVDAAEAT